eukprot:PhM_4_TR11636/c8_g1_i2/m.6177
MVAFSSVGLDLNLDKCELIATDAVSDMPDAVPRKSPDAWELLGTPLGTRQSVELRLRTLIPRIIARLEAVSHVEDARAAWSRFFQGFHSKNREAYVKRVHTLDRAAWR